MFPNVTYNLYTCIDESLICLHTNLLIYIIHTLVNKKKQLTIFYIASDYGSNNNPFNLFNTIPGAYAGFLKGGGPNFKISGILDIHAPKRHVASSEAGSLR